MLADVSLYQHHHIIFSSARVKRLPIMIGLGLGLETSGDS